MLLLCIYELCNYISYQVENCEKNSKICENIIIFTANCENNSKNYENNIIFTENCENNIIFTPNCENNSKNCDSNIIFTANYENNVTFTANCEVMRQKTQNNTFYSTGITPSRGNYTSHKTTATQNEAALSYHSVPGLYFPAVVFVTNIMCFCRKSLDVYAIVKIEEIDI